MSATESRREVPAAVWKLSLGERIRWARKRAGFSHDKLIEHLGRSNRSHLIKIERGDHVPREDLRDAIADACGVPHELFADEQEVAPSGETFRDGARSDAAARDRAGRGASARSAGDVKDAA